MIDVKDLKVTFNKDTVMETRALNGLSLSVPKGQFVCVIGSNGSGKSTLLNIVGLLDLSLIHISEPTRPY